MIYLVLRGRIGNQLFMYAYANEIRNSLDEKIIIDDSEVLKLGWENSLINYNLINVEYVHNRKWASSFFKQLFIDTWHQRRILKMPFMKKYQYQKKKSTKFQENGVIAFENGFFKFQRCTENVLLDGYFQSDKYFANSIDSIRRQYNLDNEKILWDYPSIDSIIHRNSICISIKIEHNVGSSLYDVCTKEYWEKAISYIIKKVKNPLFFICSDNVEYVKDNLIDCSKYDVIEQNTKYPVHISLAAMSKCKHFIIGNTSFGWWAQYLSENDEKIVVAPSKWMNVEMPIDIYQDGWVKIDV